MCSPATETTGQRSRDRTWRSTSLFLLTISGVAVSLFFVHVLLLPLVGAITLAIVMKVPRDWLHRKMGATAAAVVLIVAICLAVLLPGFFILRSVIGELTALVQYAQSGAADKQLHQLTAQHQKVGRLILQASDRLWPDQAGRRLASQVAVWLARGIQSVLGALTEVALLLFFLFFLLRDQESARTTFASLLPLEHDDTQHVTSKLGELVYAVFAGRFVIAGAQGALAGLSYWLLGVPGSLLWTPLTAICCLVPAFGAFLAWVPIALYLGLAHSWTKAVIMAAWGGVIVSNIDNVLYPMLVGKRTSLHTAVIFVAILGGLALFGISGFVLGPVIVAATMLILQIWKRRLGTAPSDV